MNQRLHRTPRLALLLALALPCLTAGCDRPTEADCRKAIENIDRLYDRKPDLTQQSQETRRCRGSASGPAVRCRAAAKTLDELAACDKR